MTEAGTAPPRRRGRITRSGDFDTVYRRGRSAANRHLVVYAFAREDRPPGEPPRLGLSVSRKVGGAVERNRVKPLLREAFWATATGLPAGHDFVLVARPDAGDLARAEGESGIENALRELLRDSGLAGEQAA